MTKLLQEIQSMENNPLLQATDTRKPAENKHVSRVLTELTKRTDLFAQRLTQAEMSIKIDTLIEESIPEIPPSERTKVVQTVMDHLFGYGVIQALMYNPNVSDIQISGTHYIRYVENGERKVFDYNFETDEDLSDWVQRKLRGTPFRFDRSSARTDAFLADGSRLHVKGEVVGIQRKQSGITVVKPCLIVTIRKFLGFYTLEQLVEKKLISERAYEYLCISCVIRDGFVLSGGTGTGKTTLMNALVSLSDHSHQIGILEEAPEMQPDHPFVTRFWERQENTEGNGRIGTETNLKDVLRMFLDELYVGEIRDAIMAYNFLQASNTGSGRVGTTLHASSAEGAMQRMMSLAAGSPERLGTNAVWDNIRNTIQVVMQLDRIKAQRRVTEIMEIDPKKDQGAVKLLPVFTFEWDGLNEDGLPDGTLIFHGLTDRFKKECAKWGLSIPKILLEKDGVA